MVPGEEASEGRLAVAAEDFGRLVRRLRSLSRRGWQDRREAARAALAGLVALSARLEGVELVPPTVPDHVLADAIAVVGGDVLDAVGQEGSDELAAFARIIASALEQTR